MPWRGSRACQRIEAGGVETLGVTKFTDFQASHSTATLGIILSVDKKSLLKVMRRRNDGEAAAFVREIAGATRTSQLSDGEHAPRITCK